MPEPSTEASPTGALPRPERDQRIRASLAQRSGSLDDSLGATGHEPDLIDDTGIGHCRVVVPDAWVPSKAA